MARPIPPAARHERYLPVESATPVLPLSSRNEPITAPVT